MRRSSATDDDRSDRNWPDRLIFLGLSVVTFLIPWFWGGNVDWVRGALGVAVGSLLLLWAASYAAGWVHVPRRSWLLTAALILWSAWIALIALQLLPLPPALLGRISPAALEYHDRLRDLHAAPLYTISIAPGRTVEALLDTLMLFGLYCLVYLQVNSRDRIRRFLTLIFVTGVLQAFYGIHMAVVGEHPVAAGTFVNRNHYAAYLYLAAAAGVGLVLADLGRWNWTGWQDSLRGLFNLLLSAKFRTRVMLVVIVVGVVLSQSRMGNAALFSSLSLAGLLYVLLRMRSAFLPALLLFLSMALIDLWIVSQWFGLEEVINRIENTEIETEQRPLVWQDLIPAAHTYLVSGAGLGTFAEAYSPYRSVEIRGFYDHAHNEYAEFLIETGLLGLGILGLLVVVHLLHAIVIMVMRRRSIYAAAAFAAAMSTLAVLIHAAVEFELRMPAVAATWVMLLGITAGIQGRPRDRGKARSVMSITSDGGPRTPRDG